MTSPTGEPETTHPPTGYDTNSVITALSVLVADFPKVRWVAKNRTTGEIFGAYDHFDDEYGEYSVDRIMRLNKAGFDIYMICNPVDPSFVGTKPADKDILVYDRFFIDLDPISTQPSADKLMSLKSISMGLNEAIGPENHGPSTDVWTGNGYQLHYRLKPCSEPRARVARLLSTLAAENPYSIPRGIAVNVDTCTSDASRLCRFPYTINWKNKARGTFHGNLKVEVNLDSLEPVPELGAPAFNGDLTNLSQVAPRLTRLSGIYLFEGVTEARHKAAYATAANLRALGASEELALEWVLMGADLCRPKPLPREDAIYCVRSAYKK